MANIDSNWLASLEEAFKRLYAISTSEAGFTITEIARYADLPAEQAATEIGAEYGIQHLDGSWGS